MPGAGAPRIDKKAIVTLPGAAAPVINRSFIPKLSLPTRSPRAAAVPVAVPTLAAKCLAEFIGTFLLMFTIGCNVLSGQVVWGHMSVACTLMVSIYSLGAVSGANFNPAVSVALGVSKAMGGPGLPWRIVGIYTASQTAGSLAAALLYTTLFRNSFRLVPAAGFGWLNVGLCEMFYTFLICFVVLNTTAAKKNVKEANQYYGIAIGFALLAGGYGAGAVSGGCFNPAVAAGIDVSGAGVSFAWCIAYAFFELLGGCLATVLFSFVRPEDFGRESQPNRSFALCEFIGTFMLVLTVGLNNLGSSKASGLSIAASLVSMIYAVGDISGAHFNPAVTLAVAVSGRLPELTWRQACRYVAAQLAGSLAAGLTYLTIYVGSSFPICPVRGGTWVQVAVGEFIFTFLLCYVVLSVAISLLTKSRHMFGFAIGACVVVAGSAIGHISGGSLNPAVSLGVEAAHIANGGLFYKGVLYSAFELAGGAAAAGVFSVTHKSDMELDQIEIRLV